MAGSASARTQRPAPGRELPRDEWTSLIPRRPPRLHHLGDLRANQKLLAANAQAHGADRTTGPAREGPALLQGLAICGRCGCRMSVHYHQRSGTEIPGYRCMRAAIRDGTPPCRRVPGATIDIAIGQLLLDSVTPFALEVAFTVQAELKPAPTKPTPSRSHVERARHRAERRGGATWPSTPTTGWWPTPSKPTGTTPCANSKKPKTTTSAPPPPPGPRSPKSKESASGRSPPTSPPCGRPATPATGTQTHGPPPHRRRHHQQDRQDPPPRPLPRRKDHQPDHPHPAHRAGKPAKPTLPRSPTSTGSSTTTPTPKPPTAQPARAPFRHRSALHP